MDRGAASGRDGIDKAIARRGKHHLNYPAFDSGAPEIDWSHPLHGTAQVHEQFGRLRRHMLGIWLVSFTHTWSAAHSLPTDC